MSKFNPLERVSVEGFDSNGIWCHFKGVVFKHNSEAGEWSVNCVTVRADGGNIFSVVPDWHKANFPVCNPEKVVSS